MRNFIDIIEGANALPVSADDILDDACHVSTMNGFGEIGIEQVRECLDELASFIRNGKMRIYRAISIDWDDVADDLGIDPYADDYDLSAVQSKWANDVFTKRPLGVCWSHLRSGAVPYGGSSSHYVIVEGEVSSTDIDWATTVGLQISAGEDEIRVDGEAAVFVVKVYSVQFGTMTEIAFQPRNMVA